MSKAKVIDGSSESNKAFIRGMAWGIALSSRCNVDAGGMLKESGMSAKEFKAAGVMEHDLKEIRKIEKERK